MAPCPGRDPSCSQGWAQDAQDDAGTGKGLPVYAQLAHENHRDSPGPSGGDLRTHLGVSPPVARTGSACRPGSAGQLQSQAEVPDTHNRFPCSSCDSASLLTDATPASGALREGHLSGKVTIIDTVVPTSSPSMGV